MKKLFLHIVLLAFTLFFIASCQYKFIVEPAEPPPNPVDTIYLSQDVVPIWNDGEHCTSCHKAGGTAPDLTPENAYDQIMSMGLVDTQDPPESLIYKFPNPDTDTHTWKKYTENQAATVLQWIEQGAIDN